MDELPVGTDNGVLDWYTVIMRSGGPGDARRARLAISRDQDRRRPEWRARRAAIVLWPVQVLLTVVSLAATLLVRPGIFE